MPMGQPVSRTRTRSESAERASPESGGLRKWGSLLVLSLALAIIIIDTTLLNVSLETLIRELHTTLQSLQWVISAYSLTLAALTVTGGRLGDLFGRKRMFMLGAFLFAVGSFLASISRSVPTLIVGESIIEGIGAAMMMPATASLLMAKYRGHDRAIAFGIWGGVAAAASAIGPILGGFLTTHFSWRWGFRINVGVVALLLLGSFVLGDEPAAGRKRIDGVGVFLSALGLFAIVFGIIEASSYGWIHAIKPFVIAGRELTPGGISIVPFAILFGLLVLAGFVLWERHVERGGGVPIVSTAIFRNRSFVAGASVIGILMLAQNGVIFSLPVFLQSVRGLDAFHTGLTLLPMSAMLFIVSPTAAALTKRIDHKRLVQIGLAINFIALLVLRWGLGVEKPLVGRIPATAKPEIDSRLRQQSSSLAFGGGELFERLPLAARSEMTTARRAATTDGNRKALLYGAGFVLLGLLASTRLPRRAHEEGREGTEGT